MITPMTHTNSSFLVLLAMLFAGTGTNAQVQWMRQGGLSGEGRGMATDTAGNAFTVGSVGEPALFDDDSTASHFADAFIAKYDAGGMVQWVRTGGDDLVDQANDVVVDTEGNAYVTGFFTTNGLNPTVSFDGTVITGLGSMDLFLAKYDPAGTLQWVRSGGGILAEEGRGVAITPSGSIVVSGYFQGTAEFSGQTVISAGLSDALLLAFDDAGNLLWVTTDGGNGDEKANKVDALANGDMAVVGSFQGAPTIAGSVLSAAGLSSAFLARYDGSGIGQWAVGAGSTVTFAGDEAFDVDEAPNGDLVFCGDIVGTADFDGLSLVPNGGRDIFIARYSGTGNVLWAHHAGGPQADHGYGLSVDGGGNSFLTGQVDAGASTVFDSITLSPFGNQAVFLAKYDAAGAIQWVKRYAPGRGRDVAVSDNDCLYFTGGASGIVGQPAFDSIPWQYVDRAVFTAHFCEDMSTDMAEAAPGATPLLYPNPAADRLHIAALPANALITIMDATGRAVHHGSAVNNVDVSTWPNGLYTLLVLDPQLGATRASFVVAR